MYFAVAQFAVVQVSFFGSFASQFGHACYGLAVALVLFDFLFNNFGNVQVFVEKVIHLRFHEVAHELVHADASVGFHGEGAELDFGLRFKLWFLHIDGDGSDDAGADIAVLVVLAVELLDGAGNVLLESTLVCASLDGVLPVDKGVVFLAILLVGVRKCNLYVIAFQVDDVVERAGVHRVFQQVLQSVSAHDATAVVVDFQASVQVGVVAQHVADKLVLELVVEEEGVVWLEVDERPVLFSGLLCLVIHQFSFLKHGCTHHSVAITPHFEASR